MNNRATEQWFGVRARSRPAPVWAWPLRTAHGLSWRLAGALIGAALVGLTAGCSSATPDAPSATEAASEPLSPTVAAVPSLEVVAVTPEAGVTALAEAGVTAVAAGAGNADELADLIVVSAPVAGASVASPLAVAGQARGTWYFEANFPVRLEDATGNVVGEGFATAEGEWMTEEFVPFTATIEFGEHEPGFGQLVLSRANPSGLAENDQELRVPVTLD